MSGICSNIQASASRLPLLSSFYLLEAATYIWQTRGNNSALHTWLGSSCLRSLLLLHKQSQMSRLMTSKAAMVGSIITSTVPGTLYFLPASVVNWYRCTT
jgi:hypothetical protein